MDETAEQIERDLLYIEFMIANHNVLEYDDENNLATLCQLTRKQEGARVAMQYSVAYYSGTQKDVRLSAYA
jgi:hypothetical protein